MYRNATDFCIFILYPATLLNLCISSNSFFHGVFWVFYIEYHVSVKIKGLTSSLPIWMPFLFVVWLLRLGLLVLCWIAVVRVDIPVVFLILGERLPVFPHWEWYLLWAFHRWLLRCWGTFPLSLHSEEFWSGMDAVLVFSLADMINNIDCFMSVEPALHPGDKFHLVMVNDLLNVLLDPIG